MTIDRIVLAFAGTLVLVSLALGLLVSAYWFVLTGLVGLNLFQSAFTGFCPLAIVLKKFGLTRSGYNFHLRKRNLPCEVLRSRWLASINRRAFT